MSIPISSSLSTQMIGLPASCDRLVQENYLPDILRPTDVVALLHIFLSRLYISATLVTVKRLLVVFKKTAERQEFCS